MQEALISIKQSKTRSILAGFGVAWGIFILIILLGAGKGFQKGILQLFSSFAKNSLWVYGGEVSEDNLNKSMFRKFILFDQTDIAILKRRFHEIESISPELNFSGNSLTSYQQYSTYPLIKGVQADYFNVKIIKPEEGRLLNILDNKEYRRVALIGWQIADVLFPSESPLGKSININGTYFTIVGIIKKDSIFTQNEQNAIYVPYNSFTDCLNESRGFNTFVLTLSEKTDATVFEKEVKSFLSKRKGFDPDDKKALFILNFENQVKEFNKLFNGVNIFLWFIGSCLLLSGIVGISNIMLVIVKERTFEIGIRKAIGAKSQTILAMILTESIMITTIAGAIGLSLGALFIGLLNWIIASFFDSNDMLFTSASIDFPVVIFALFILVFAGCFAGFLPAKKAADITPVEAIRYESR